MKAYICISASGKDTSNSMEDPSNSVRVGGSKHLLFFLEGTKQKNHTFLNNGRTLQNVILWSSNYQIETVVQVKSSMTSYSCNETEYIWYLYSIIPVLEQLSCRTKDIRGNVYNMQSGLLADASSIPYHCWHPMMNFVANRSIFSLLTEESFTYSFYLVNICKSLFCFSAKDLFFFPLLSQFFKNSCIIYTDKAKCSSSTYFSLFTLKWKVLNNKLQYQT